MDLCGSLLDSVTLESISSQLFSAFSVAVEDASDIAEPGRGGWSNPDISGGVVGVSRWGFGSTGGDGEAGQRCSERVVVAD
jgi:hypothetical protein